MTAGQSAAPTSLASVTFGTVGESHNVMVAATDQVLGNGHTATYSPGGRQVMKMFN